MQVMIPGLGTAPVDIQNIPISVSVGVAPQPMTPTEFEQKYKSDPEFRIHALNLSDQQRKNSPLVFIKNMALVNKRAKSNADYRKWLRADLLKMWSTHPQLAKHMYVWLPDLYAVSKTRADNLARYREYTGFRRWSRSKLLLLSRQNPAAFINLMTAENKLMRADPELKLWRQKDIASMKRNHYADIAAVMIKALPDLYKAAPQVTVPTPAPLPTAPIPTPAPAPVPTPAAASALSENIRPRCVPGYHNVFKNKLNNKLLWATDRIAPALRSNPNFTFVRIQKPCQAPPSSTKEVIADAIHVPPTTQEVLDTVVRSDTPCVNCQPTASDSVNIMPTPEISVATQPLDEQDVDITDSDTNGFGILTVSAVAVLGTVLYFVLRK